mmetsp:Transcript_27966/g.75351  ORF Transcript_27966/g.75351 Transcript_27966/m.75351 type:complete len:250 (+) Transcript_27966:996-1745(+)
MRDDVVVGHTRRLLQVADKAVQRLGVDEVGSHEQRRERELGGDDEASGDRACFEHLHANEEMHALVLSLLEEGVDPAVVLLEQAQGPEVAEPRGHEAGYASDALEDDEAPLDGPGCWVHMAVAGNEVEGVVEAVIHEGVDRVIKESLRLVVVVDGLELLVELLGRPNVVLLAADVVGGGLLHGLIRFTREARRLGAERMLCPRGAEVCGPIQRVGGETPKGRREEARRRLQRCAGGLGAEHARTRGYHA